MATMTQTRQRLATQGCVTLRKTVSSPAAAAAAAVHSMSAAGRASPRTCGEGADKSETSASPTSDTSLTIDVKASSAHRVSSGDSNECASSKSTLSQRATPVSSAPAVGDATDPSGGGSRGGSPLMILQKQRAVVPDGPVYAALKREIASFKLEDSIIEASAASASPQACASELPPSHPHQPQQSVAALERSLDEAKTSNRLLSRALAAVQHHMKHVETECDQLRRERDYFRNVALRFPFTLSHP